MRRTSAAAIVVVAVVGGAAGWLLQVALVSKGAPSFIPPPSFWSVLFLVAVALLALGWPIRRSMKGRVRRRVAPFYAMRVLVLAKASSLTGALLLGVGLVLVVYAVSRTGSTATPAFPPSVLTAVAALVLGVAGLVVEGWCRVPPDDAAVPEDRLAEQR